MKEKMRWLTTIIFAGIMLSCTTMIVQAEQVSEKKLEEYYNTVLIPKDGKLNVEGLTVLDGASGIVSHAILDTNKDGLPELWVCYYDNPNFEMRTYEISSKGEVIFTREGDVFIGEFSTKGTAGSKGCFFVDNGEKVSFATENTHLANDGGWGDTLTLRSFEKEDATEDDILANLNVYFSESIYGAGVTFDGRLDGVRYLDEELCSVKFTFEGDSFDVEENQKRMDNLCSEYSDFLKPVGIEMTNAKRKYANGEKKSIESMVDIKSSYVPHKDAKIYYLFDWKYCNITGNELSLVIYDN